MCRFYAPGLTPNEHCVLVVLFGLTRQLKRLEPQELFSACDIALISPLANQSDYRSDLQVRKLTSSSCMLFVQKCLLSNAWHTICLAHCGALLIVGSRFVGSSWPWRGLRRWGVRDNGGVMIRVEDGLSTQELGLEFTRRRRIDRESSKAAREDESLYSFSLRTSCQS